MGTRVSVEKGEQRDTKDDSTTEIPEYPAWRYLEQCSGSPKFSLQQKEKRMPNGDCLSGWSLTRDGGSVYGSGKMDSFSAKLCGAIEELADLAAGWIKMQMQQNGGEADQKITAI